MSELESGFPVVHNPRQRDGDGVSESDAERKGDGEGRWGVLISSKERCVGAE